MPHDEHVAGFRHLLIGRPNCRRPPSSLAGAVVGDVDAVAAQSGHAVAAAAGPGGVDERAPAGGRGARAEPPLAEGVDDPEDAHATDQRGRVGDGRPVPERDGPPYAALVCGIRYQPLHGAPTACAPPTSPVPSATRPPPRTALICTPTAWPIWPINSTGPCSRNSQRLQSSAYATIVSGYLAYPRNNPRTERLER